VFWNRHAPRREPPVDPTDSGLDPQDLRVAYERGRHDERAARKRHPILMSLTLAAAVVGGVVIVLAAREGSFAGGGARFDEGVSVAATKAEPVVRDAATDAGAALKDAGRSLRNPDQAADKAG
jgi:hypothetical protein